jgi:hypothetical protein
MTANDRYLLVCAYKNAWLALKDSPIDVSETDGWFTVKKQSGVAQKMRASALLDSLTILTAQLAARHTSLN